MTTTVTKKYRKKLSVGKLEKFGKTRVGTIRTETRFLDFMVMVYPSGYKHCVAL
jgi:hypothetical protein